MATPFVAGSDPTEDLPDRNTFEQLSNQWSTFLDQPGGRAALLSAGLALMQPPSFGDTATSQVGRAIGAGGEAVGRQEAMNIRQQEADSKAFARETAANAAEARASRAGAGQELAAERLRGIQERSDTSNKFRGLQAFIAYQNNLRQENANALRRFTSDINNIGKAPPPPTPSLSYPEFIQANPTLRGMGLIPGESVGPGVTPGAPRVGEQGLSEDQIAEAEDWLARNPNHPRAAAVRAKLQGAQ